MGPIIICITLGIILTIFCLAAQLREGSETAESLKLETDKAKTGPDENTDYSQSYQKKYLLTKNEWYEYKKLKKQAEARQWQVCPKVRLLDLIEPRHGTKNYKSLFYKIQAKHVDFVICDQNLYIKAIVEIDDNSHNQADRMERDRFVDEILTSVGYKVIRTKSITEDTLKVLDVAPGC